MNHPDTSVKSPKAASAQAAGLAGLLGAAPRRRWWQRTTLWIGVAALLGAAGGVYAWQSSKAANAAPSYVTEEVRRGNLTLSVAANGTLQPTRSVTIGSELSGTVRNVLVDVNDKVKKGQVLVELDTAKLEAQVLRSRASLAAAQARLAQAVATTKEATAGLARLQEGARLSGGKGAAATEMGAGHAPPDRAKADEGPAPASVDDARAALSTDETNLSKASIRSPINGVVRTLTRVVSELQAMGHEVEVIHPGQFKTFPLPTYAEIKVAIGVYEPVQEQFKAFEPEAIHIATEGPIGLAAQRINVEWKLPPVSRCPFRRACRCRWRRGMPT